MAESPSGRRQQAERRRAELVDSALVVFAEKGINGTTVKDLSKAAGVSEGLMYHYFRSKEALLHAVLENHYFLPDLKRIVAPGRDRPAAEVLRQTVQGFGAVLREHRLLVRLMVREASTNSQVADRLARARREGVRMLSEYLESRVRAGELRPHDSGAVAQLLFLAAMSTHLMLTGDDTDKGFLSSAVEIVLNGISSR